MGILSSLAGKAAVAAGKSIVKGAATTAIINSIDKSREKIAQKIINEEPDTHHLLIDLLNHSKEEGFIVYDVHEQKRFFVYETESALILYDLNKNRIGEVNKKTINRSQFIENEVKEFSFTIYGQYIGVMTSQIIKKRQKYITTFADWHVSKNLTGTHFAVLDKKNRVVAKISGKGLAWDYDVISFPNKDDELLGLLVILAIRSNTIE